MQEQTKYAPNNNFWNYVSVGLEVVTQTYFVGSKPFCVHNREKKMLHKIIINLTIAKNVFTMRRRRRGGPKTITKTKQKLNCHV